jgi:hypothetical protein
MRPKGVEKTWSENTAWAVRGNVWTRAHNVISPWFQDACVIRAHSTDPSRTLFDGQSSEAAVSRSSAPHAFHKKDAFDHCVRATDSGWIAPHGGAFARPSGGRSKSLRKGGHP